MENNLILKNGNNNFYIEKKVNTCGKLYIGGEYSILTPGQSAIIKNVNIYMTGIIKISENENYKIYSDMFDYEVSLNYDKNYKLIQETVITINEYLKNINIKTIPFEFKISGKMEKNGKKYGIGSSGSVVILTIKAMFEFYNFNYSEDLLFKLASYILIKNGDNGSMGDIACIAYENLIIYKSFDRKKISSLVEKLPLESILKIDWGYNIEKIENNINFEFLVGWTKEPSISKDMINKVKQSINEKYLENTEKSVQNLKKAFIKGEKEIIKKEVKNISNLLVNLNPFIYSEKLIKLVNGIENLDICAKCSGAGGGDCGIALSFNEEDSKKIIKYWEKNDIDILYIEKV